MTAAERLVALAGTGGQASVLLAMIGSGDTTGAALVNYSGLSSGTAATHLLTDITGAVQTPWLLIARRRLRR